MIRRQYHSCRWLGRDTKEFSALPDPCAHDVLAFAVVIVSGQMSAEISAPVADFFAGEHQLWRLIQSGRTADLTECCLSGTLEGSRRARMSSLVRGGRS